MAAKVEIISESAKKKVEIIGIVSRFDSAGC
jgi:hypothetical protein